MAGLAGAAGRGSASRRSIAQRNAASVFPDPVGAMTRAFSPREMASQASRCTLVGSPSARSNHARVGPENCSMHPVSQRPPTVPPSLMVEPARQMVE